METLKHLSILMLGSDAIIGTGSKLEPNLRWHKLTVTSSKFSKEVAGSLLSASLLITRSGSQGTELKVPEDLYYSQLYHHKYKLMIGYIFYNKKLNQLFIIFTGTYGIHLIGTDIMYAQDELKGLSGFKQGFKGHGGIYDIYLGIRDQIIQNLKNVAKKSPKVIISGHSLGGALSVFCSWDLAKYDPINYSFASPLVFNPAAAEEFNRRITHSYRIHNESDLVTLMPLPIMPNGDLFNPVGKSVQFVRNYGNESHNHVTAYLDEFAN